MERPDTLPQRRFSRRFSLRFGDPDRLWLEATFALGGLRRELLTGPVAPYWLAVVLVASHFD